jgi:hypothetical protein
MTEKINYLENINHSLGGDLNELKQENTELILRVQPL